MASLASFARMFGTPITDQFFQAPPQQLPMPSVQPYEQASAMGDLSQLQQQQNFNVPISEPDMGAARSRTLDSLGPLLAFVPLFLAAKNKKKGMAAFARALAESAGREKQTQTALETWKAEQQNRMQQQKYEQAMAQIKEGRSLLEKALALDPALAGNPSWQQSWLAGDPSFLAQSGWKPPVKPEARDKYQLTEVGGRKVLYDPFTGEIVKDLGPSGGPKEPKEPKAPARSDVVDGAWRNYYALIQQGKTPEEAWMSLSVEDKALIRRDPSKPDPLAAISSLIFGGSDGDVTGSIPMPETPVPVPVPTNPPVIAKKRVSSEVYNSLIADAQGNSDLVRQIQEKYEPIL